MKYELFCNSVRGASHIHKDIPCEDYGMKKDCGDYKIFVTSDGHGDPNCFRSQNGSKFICESVVSNLEKFAEGITSEGKESELFNAKTAEKRIRHLVTCIMADWLRKVNENFREYPPTAEEYDNAKEYAPDFKKGIRIERAFGATVIAGLKTEKFLLLLHQGDGRCVVFNSDGSASQPIPWDDRCVGNMTTSLCDPDAIPSFRYHVIDLEKNPVLACFAGSDGIEDSFPTSMEKTHVFYRELLDHGYENYIDDEQSHMDELENHMEKILGQLSAQGSQDDMTVTGFADFERVGDFTEKFARENQYVDLMSQRDAVESKIRSIEQGGKRTFLKTRYEDSVSKLTEISERLEKVKAEYEVWASQYAIQQENPEDLAEKLGEEISSGDVLNSNDTEQVVWNKPKLKLIMLKFIKGILWPEEFRNITKRNYEKLLNEKTALDQEKEIAEAAAQKAKDEFFPYDDNYQKLLESRKELDEQINNFNNQKSDSEQTVV